MQPKLTLADIERTERTWADTQADDVAQPEPIEEWPPLSGKPLLVAIGTVVLAMAASALLPLWVTP